MKKRVFIAIPASPLLREEILLWEEQYKNPLARRIVHRSFGGGPGEAEVHWLAPKNLHVTLISPWYEERTERIYMKLELFQRTRRSFPIEFHAVRYGPNEKHPRLIWAEGKITRELLALKDGFEELLGAKKESRPFRLHLTLARFRPETFSSFRIKKLNQKIHWEDAVRSIALMESHLSPEGADYEILAEFPFSA